LEDDITVRFVLKSGTIFTAASAETIGDVTKAISFDGGYLPTLDSLNNKLF